MREDFQRGQQALQLLNNPVFELLMEDLQRQALHEIRTARPWRFWSFYNRALHARARLKTADDLAEAVRVLINKGKLAEHEITERRSYGTSDSGPTGRGVLA